MTTALRLTTREQRKKLAPRDRPYFVELRRGLLLGYRRGTEGGSWLLREFKADASHKWGGRYVQRRLGAADDTAPADGVAVLSWQDAQTQALGSERPTVTKPGKYTVSAAWEDYCAARAAPPDVRETALWDRFIAPELGSRPIAELTTAELERWRAKQLEAHGARRPNGTGEQDPKERHRKAQYTANRRWNLLRAVLNAAYRRDPARVPSSDAWDRIRSFQRVDRPRLRALNADEARRLLGVLQEPLKALARGALESGLRLGELESLRAADVGPSYVTVRGKGGKVRTVPLAKDGAAFFRSHAADKAPGNALFERMNHVAISRQMRSACTAAEITPPAIFHDLRRSYGSLLLNSGAAAGVVQVALGHSDMRMTVRTYAHLLQETVAEQIQEHLPSFTGDSAKKRKPSRKRARQRV